jgi:hypothetical protein
MKKIICLFNTTGIGALIVSLALFGYMLALKYYCHTSFIETPLPVLVAMYFMIGVQLILMTLLAEINMRTYHET